MLFVAASVMALFFTTGVSTAEEAAKDQPTQFTITPIGQVEKSQDRTTIVLDKNYQPGLLGLDDWSHVWVFWWFDKNDTPQQRAILKVHPRGNRNNPLTGVFATRSPVRPNLIAQTLCKITSVKDNVIEIENIDAFPGTPVIDLKPYARGIDSASDIRTPDWTRKQPSR